MQVCNSDTASCGPDHEVYVEWGCVSVVALSQSVVAFAYSDVQVGHRGSLVKCDVANSNLNFDLAHVFEESPIVSVTLTALTTDTLAYTSGTTDLLIAYQVSSLTQRFANVQPCLLTNSKIVCYHTSSARLNNWLTSGISLTALSSTAFFAGYSDHSLSCPNTNRQGRRRAAEVCTKADGHPTIGRMRLCRATFRGLGITDPVLECGESAVVEWLRHWRSLLDETRWHCCREQPLALPGHLLLHGLQRPGSTRFGEILYCSSDDSCGRHTSNSSMFKPVNCQR